jgi:hypothetical protein
MVRSRRSLFFGVLLTLFCCAPLAHAQQDASMAGIVTDETKAVLPGATVTATNLETGTQSSSVTDEHGQYRLLRLLPGKYKVQAELQGFASVVVPSVELLVGQNANVPFVLKIASVSETLTITAESPLVDVSSSQVAGNVDRRQMEQMPLQGRNWMELSKLVKGITANDVTNTPGVGSDDMFQLNLDGQQITQKIAGSGFGQPRFSREAIAEFQIITNMFDITQGRSAGIQVQAISKSGTNVNSGSFYGFFRDDSLNAPDKVAKKVLPYANQQIGGAFGGPIVKDKLHYFASYEHEREPGTLFVTPSALPGQNFTIPYKNGQKSFLARVDDQMSSNNRLSIRGSRWTWSNPFVLTNTATLHPSNASVQTKAATNILGSWAHIAQGTNRVQEIRVGYNAFDWTNAPLDSMVGTPQYDFPGLTIGAPYNYPQHPKQNNFEARYDLNWHKGSHDVKIGGEYLHVKHSGDWYIQSVGRYTMNGVPSNLGALVPPDAVTDPSRWNLAGLSSFVQRFDKNYSYSGWENIIDSPRPTWAIWFGDNWRVGNQLTVNYGIRWDADPNTASAPNVKVNSILINPGFGYGQYSAGITDYGYKKGIRDWKDVAPRAGFTWNVGGRGDFVIRGGSGLYFASPVSNVTFSPGVYSNLITATFANDGRSDFITNPTNGVPDSAFLNGSVPLPVQSPRVIVAGFKNPYTWQSSIGFQKQLNAVTGFEADLTHYDEYRDTRSIDANLAYNPATGYNRTVSLGRPNPAWGQVLAFTSDGRKDQTQISTALNRRLQKNFQAGVTYTLMLAMHDNGTLGYTAPTANNPFDYLDGEYATSTEFQRNTIRAWGLYQFPWGIATSVSYFYGSGNRFNATIAATPYGKTGNNRLNLTNTGGAANTITIPAAVADRFNGPTTITSGMVIPRNALEGLPLHKVDLRLTKDIRFVGTFKASLIGEVFNLFNHANYGSYNSTLSATNAATTALFGTPAQNTNNAYVPRTGQLAFRLSF